MKRALLVAVFFLGCHQTPHVITPINGKENPLGIKCFAGYCDARNEACRPPTSDYPDGYCAFIGDSGRAFGARGKRPEGFLPVVEEVR